MCVLAFLPFALVVFVCGLLSLRLRAIVVGGVACFWCPSSFVLLVSLIAC